MKFALFFRACCFICLVLSSASTLASTPPGNVDVHYRDAAHFTEAKRSFGLNAIGADAYLKPLKAYFAQRASRILAPGQRLDIEVTDVDRAGEYEPWRGADFRDVRIVKDIYPPRIDLDFVLYGADGKVLRKGSRKLRDPDFINRAMATDQDSLRYEKSLINQWLRKGADKL